MKRLPSRIEDALDAAGAVLIRNNPHRVYKLRSGAMLTISNSPSDHRAQMNILADIRRLSRTPHDDSHRTPQAR